jgi:hypothetical protein
MLHQRDLLALQVSPLLGGIGSGGPTLTEHLRAAAEPAAGAHTGASRLHSAISNRKGAQPEGLIGEEGVQVGEYVVPH